MLRRVRDWLFTVPFILGFFGTLLVFDPLQRFFRLFGQRPHEVVVGVMQWCIVASLRCTGMRLLVERSPLVQPGVPYIVVANHQSMFDIPVIGALLFTNYPKYVSKRDLARGIPSISYNLRRGGHALIDRTRREEAMAEITRLGREQVAARRVSAVIYPEGTRARAGDLAPFRVSGTFALMAAAPEAAVVPLAVDNLWRIVRHGLKPVPFGTRVHVSIGDPIPRSAGESPDAVLERCRRHMEEALARWRGVEGPPPAIAPPAGDPGPAV